MTLSTRPALVLATLVLASCAAGRIGPPLPVTDGSLLDDYKLVQGMTEGVVASDGVTRAQLVEIIGLDRAAVGALVALATDSSDAARLRARGAIQALADYDAAASAAPPVGEPSALSRTRGPSAPATDPAAH